MRKLVLPLSIVLAVMMPLVGGRLLAGWLVGWLERGMLWGWVMGLVTAVVLTLIFIAGWALYRDDVWRGLMHPLAYVGSIALLIIALLSLPSLWGHLRLIAEGETAVGTIESLTTGLDYDRETSVTVTIYYVTYQFMTDTGESLQERIVVSQPLFQSLGEGAAIVIVYLPERPTYSLPETALFPANRARRVLMYLLAVFVVLAETAVIHFFWGRGLESFLERWD